MCLPKPDYSFTIPSVHDDTTLDCRLHHPKLHHEDLLQATKAAIIAHPYAPLGGCYDDPVVSSIGKTLLNGGYIVGTFNFRGAGGSVGRTSWSAKPELADYVSFYGFMLSYLSHIKSLAAATPCTPEEPASASTLARPVGQTKNSSGASQPVRLLLAGYSYGSMIASHLPSAEVVLDLFQSAPIDSAVAEIRLRASTMAQLLKKDVQSRQQKKLQGRGPSSLKASGAYPGSSHAVSVGGFESESASRRISRESSRHSHDFGVRQSIDRIRERFASKHGSGPEDSPVDTAAVSDVQLVDPEICYLLVSPVLPPVASFTTVFSSLSFAAKKKSSSVSAGDIPVSTPSRELISHPSCAVYGDNDTFTSRRKLRKWADQLKQKPNSQFQFFEVKGAGHLWREKELVDRMKGSIQEWLRALDAL